MIEQNAWRWTQRQICQKQSRNDLDNKEKILGMTLTTKKQASNGIDNKKKKKLEETLTTRNKRNKT